MIGIAAAILIFGGLADNVCPDDSNTPVPYEGGWYFAIGGTNYYPRLRESEAEINRRINDAYGWLPGWEKPTTFADWREKHFIWELNIGLGKDLSPKTTLMLWAGGISGTIKNKHKYGPLDTDIRFSRTVLFLHPELSWYPKGKVDYAGVAEKRGSDWIRAAIAGAKPYLAAAAGYTWDNTEGKGKMKLPLLGTVLRQSEKEVHHLFMVGPRVGIEAPTGRNSSVSAAVGYHFYTTHSREYNGLAISFNLRKRF